MTKTKALAPHVVLPAKVRGDTLIISPNGDLLSHDPRDFEAELSRLKAVIREAQVRHLVVDLSGSDYFGSRMLGGLISLKNQLGDGGRAVLCDLSEAQCVGLRVMKIEDQFETAPSRRQAVQMVCRLSAKDYARMFRKPLAALLLIGLCWGLYESRLAYKVFGSGVKSNYEQVAALWVQYRDGAPQLLTGEEKVRWEVNLREEIAAQRARLSDRNFYLTRDANLLGRATATLDDIVNRREAPYQYSDFRVQMYGARNRLQQRTGLQVEKPIIPDEDLLRIAQPELEAQRKAELQQVSVNEQDETA